MKSMRTLSSLVWRTAAGWRKDKIIITTPERVDETLRKERRSKANLRGFTREEADRYYTQLEETHGFDMDDVPPVAIGLIMPMNMHTDPEAKVFANQFGRFAIEDYNNKMAEGGGVMLEFVKPLKICVQCVAGFNYFITFEAKDVGASDHQSRIYQAKVYNGIQYNEVIVFRPKPTGPVNSADRGGA